VLFIYTKFNHIPADVRGSVAREREILSVGMLDIPEPLSVM
jgi:hypothetical protein